MLSMRLFSKIFARLGSTVKWSIALLLILVSSPVIPAKADTSICGPINTNTTWTTAGNNYIVTCDAIVNTGVTLTIQPGVVVKFDAGTSLQVNGTLVATGATFTSNSAIPAKGDWRRIYFTSTSVDAVFDSEGNYLFGSKIQDCTVEWGGEPGAVQTDGASPFIYLNQIRNNYGSGIYAIGRSTAQPIVIRENQLNSNSNPYNGIGGGIYVKVGRLVGNTITGNTPVWAGGIYAQGSTMISNTVSGNTDIGGGADAGGGIVAVASIVENNLVAGNSGFHGGIHALGNSTVLSNTVSNNTGFISGGIFMEGGTASRNLVNGNSTPNSGGGINAANATVENNTVFNNSASIGGGLSVSNSNLTGNTVRDNQASNEGGGIYLLDSTISDNVIEQNTASKGGGIYALNDWIGNPSIMTVSGNAIEGNTASSGGGIYSIESNLVGNMVMSNTATANGAGIYADGGIVNGNSLTNNAIQSFGHGSGAYLTNVSDFSYNDVLSNTASGGTAGGVTISGPSALQYNNLYGNQPYDAEVVSAEPVTGTLNYWGLTACTAIPARIYDGSDVPGRGMLSYAPSLYLPAPVNQMSAPAGLALTSDATGVTLSWTPLSPVPDVGCRVPGISGPDLQYRLYYDSDSACAPFNGTSLSIGPSPIAAGAVSQFRLTGAPQQGLFYTVTAVDYLGRESHFSNVVGTSSEGYVVYFPLLMHR